MPEETIPGRPAPLLRAALWRGLRCRCPECGLGALFDGYLTVRPHCAVCDAPVGLARADDAPPYFTIFIVGHLVVGTMVIVDRAWSLSGAAQLAIFLPLTLALTLALLRPVKGATVGLMLHLGLTKANDEA